MTTQKPTKMNDKLFMKIAEILGNYKFNSTQTETCEMIIDRIIRIIKFQVESEHKKKFDNFIKNLKEEICGEVLLCNCEAAEDRAKEIIDKLLAGDRK